ncbi:L-ascorbate metabolism protein UlaG (beta-lactamase superfamily) [Paenibacillus cellulosilyticus]|uniref:L-ascorbate metabolism protein UlaG (Beta-lactamase superfamily) n=1 Tax=Paenibacillus cellulosilyticus TaxID=375489 RepID=A0A2V2YVI7_9BACL|nr:MBL fold metallo-hydrolase [Paenibacillus cellulosilyticus]PWW05158.1 L-ascorbate metabolism protein UlaG (beta-lactamase superfamily) [Paenibacillus cellulosilyticus]QKS48697.1 MBL fold metallo-hydrolase [Paenibacillus cellulosilyticus]
MRMQLIRHATLWLDYAGTTFLVDPMFSDQGANPPIMNSDNERRNPLVPLPDELDAWLAPDAVIVTHLHPDHWDTAAIQALSKSSTIVCQPGNSEAIRTAGFADVTEVAESFTFQGITIHRTDGQHGTGEIGQLMGQVSGFVFQVDGEPTLYIAGDTIWCDDVQNTLDAYKPDHTVVNAGGARFVVGDAITMDAEDVIQVVQYAPYTRVIAVHMDSINHCHATRDVLRAELAEHDLLEKVAIPGDGEWVLGS